MFIFVNNEVNISFGYVIWLSKQLLKTKLEPNGNFEYFNLDD